MIRIILLLNLLAGPTTGVVQGAMGTVEDMIYGVPAMALCTQAIDGPFSECWKVPGAHQACKVVAIEAYVQSVDPEVAISVSYFETRFKDAPSYAGRRLLDKGTQPDQLPSWSERSAMQCKPKFFCPGGKVSGCRFLENCMEHLANQLDRPRFCRLANRAERERRPKRRAVCFPIESDSSARVRLRMSLDRYKMPYSPSDGYGFRVMFHYDRLKGHLDAWERRVRRSG